MKVNMGKKLYTQEDLQNALQAWSNAKQSERERLWYLYCDIRDQLPVGTTEAKNSHKTRAYTVGLVTMQ